MRLFSPARVALLAIPYLASAEPAPFRFEVKGDSRATQTRLLAAPGKEPIAALALQWLHPDLPASDERWRHGPRVEGRFKRERAGITQTWFTLAPPRVGVLHLRADKPGALGFRIILEGGETEVSERRRLTVSTALPDGRRQAVRAWVFPMESEVIPEERTIRVEGEGEALVLVTSAEAPADELEAALEAPLRSLGFGEAEMPDLSKVWATLDELQKQQEAASSR